MFLEVLGVNVHFNRNFHILPSTASLTPTVLYWGQISVLDTAGLQFHSVPAGGDRPFTHVHTDLCWEVLVLR